MIGAVLSYHLNPATCGVAKFNHALAKRLGVPCLPCSEMVRYPLISVKTSELPANPYPTWRAIDGFDLFLHDDGAGLWTNDSALTQARRVFAGNQQIADSLRPLRPDIITAFCPSTIDGNPSRGSYRVLAFGMAHKLLIHEFETLKKDLDRDHGDYTVSLSTAVHEGSPWDEGLATSVEAMRGVFGDRLRVLGFLADDALARELQECDAVAVFFDPAMRANNTSAWAAIAAGKPLYTNFDELSPPIDHPEHYSWDALLKVLA